MKSFVPCSVVVSLVCLSALPASAQVRLRLTQTVSLSGIFNTGNTQGAGTHASAVAWNGSTAFLAGYNAAATTQNIGLVGVSNVFSTPTFTSVFGQLSTATNRGYSGLDISGNLLATAWDNGVASANSIRLFNTANTATPVWTIGSGASDSTRRGGSGVAFDPGFNSQAAGQGVAFTTFGSGRRGLLDTTNGTYKFNLTNNPVGSGGMIFNTNPTNTNWRDIDFDPLTGDLYSRQSNRVTRASRSGDNNVTGGVSTVISSFVQQGTATTNNINLQNLAFVRSGPDVFVLANDRSVTGAGQAFTTVIQALAPTGETVPLLWDFGTFAAPANGNGAYDFSYDRASNTVAISDFANRNLYIFSIINAPEPGSLLLCLTAGTGWLIRRRR